MCLWFDRLHNRASAARRISGIEPGGPLGWHPILYACYSRFLRRDPERAKQIVQVVRLLLEHGADANSHYLIEHGEGKLAQTCTYGAAGIANHVALTQILLQAGADAGERVDGRSANEAIYHAAEFEDVACLRLLGQKKRPIV
jgi:hypothetical protein